MDEHDIGQRITMEVLVKVYLVGREDPILCPTALSLPAEVTQNVADLMAFCTDVFCDDLDSKSATFIVLGDTRHDHRIILKDRIDAICVLAPEKFPEGMNESAD